MTDISQTKYKPGDKIRVGTGNPAGHCRTPAYVRGKKGTVVKLYGAFLNPESLGHGGSGLPKQPMYQVEFEQGEVWDQYNGPVRDKVVVDLFQHWLEFA